jgi:hypothetical protein
MKERKVLISGASGLIGSAIVSSFAKQGCDIHRLTRGQTQEKGAIPWDPSQPVAEASVSGFGVVVHLAGENVFGIWTNEKKRRIRDSRNIGTRNLAEALARARQKPQIFICASAIGYYGNRGDEILTEESGPGTGFLAEECREWEAAATPASDAGIRTVNIRVGVVLSRAGGALSKMLPAFRMGFGGKIGTGKQWLSWIHIDDLVAAVAYLADHDSMRGPVNVVSPNPVTNAEFTRILARVLSRPAFFRIPEFALRVALGQAAEELLLSGQRVIPARLAASGYSFQFSDLKDAIKDLLQNNK